VRIEVKARNFESDAVLVGMPPLSEYAPALTARIKKESLRVINAPGHLSHVNLLIVDREHRLAGTPVQEVCLHLLTPEMKRALLGTPYREVFLTTTVKELGACFFPLKVLFVASEGFLLNRALHEFYHSAGVLSWDEEVEVYAAFLRQRGAAAGVAVRRGGRLEMLFGNAGFSITENGVQIHDYADHPLPPTRAPSPQPTSCNLLSHKFLEFFENWSGQKVFTSGLAYPIAQQA
jgi:hypothetical protein